VFTGKVSRQVNDLPAGMCAMICPHVTILKFAYGRYVMIYPL